MSKSLKNVFINSSIAFVSAFFITTFIHESGHFIAYFFQGANPVLFHNYVNADSENLSSIWQVISALAGPVFSLFQGIIFSIVVLKRKQNKALDLLFLWMGLLGFINFFGYLMLTPLFTGGDTGKAAHLLDIDFRFRILIAFLGLVVALLLIIFVSRTFSNFIPKDAPPDVKRKYVYQLMFYPILAGSIINTLFAFPIPTVVSAIYPATSSFIIMSSFGAIMKNESQFSGKSAIENGILKSFIILVLVCIVINRLLTPGMG